MQMIIIAGKAGVGKTTLAKMIAKEAFEIGLRPQLLSFAGPLKEEAKAKGYDKEEFPEKYREYCQETGAALRKLDPDHWVKIMHESVDAIVEEEQKMLASKSKYWEQCIIIDDCRYTNEVAYGLEKDAVLLFLSSGKRHLKDSVWRAHHSETLANTIESDDGEELRDLFHHVIFNDKDKKHLSNRIKDMVPIWCGITICSDDKPLLCSCEGCRAKRDGRKINIQELYIELLDLIDFKDIEIEEEDEETE